MSEVSAQGRRVRLDEELHQLRELVLRMGDALDSSIARTTHALVERDPEAAAGVIADDNAVNSLQADIRELTFTVILTQQPVARDLRELISIMHMASELERMGDHCVNIARIARDLVKLPPVPLYIDIPKLADFCAEQVRDMLSAVVARDPARAREVASRDERINKLYHHILDDLLTMMVADSETVYAGTHVMLAALNYERIGDRVTNLAEDLVFLESGEIVELG